MTGGGRDTGGDRDTAGVTGRGRVGVDGPVPVADNGRVRYGILGTTQALRDDGTAVAIGGARLRALLAVLALRTGRTVPVAVLVDEVWDGEPPADAPGALQALVGRLRRILGHAAVASADNGYRLAAEPDSVDLYRFERLAGEGARALAAGDPAKALSVLDDALGLWRGPALADLPDRHAVAARWTARRLDARRTRFDAALALGRADEVLPELAALCDEHPSTNRSRPCGCGPCATPGAWPRRWPRTTRCGPYSPTGSVPTRGPS